MRTLIDLDTLADLFPWRVAKATELVRLGITGEQIAARCGSGGPWRRLLSGIVLLAHGPPSRHQLVQAAVRYAEPDALVTGHDALQLHGVRSAIPGGPVHVLLPRTRRLRGNAQVRIERVTTLPEPRLRAGLPTVSVARAAVDAGRLSGVETAVRTLFGEVLGRGLTTLAELRAELSRCGDRGITVPRRVLRALADDERTAVHGRARTLVLRAGLPVPLWNAALCAGGGEPLGVVGGWWDNVGLAWIIDHDAADYGASVRQAARLTATGITVVHTIPARLSAEPAAVADELRAAYQHAGARPLPPITGAPPRGQRRPG